MDVKCQELETQLAQEKAEKLEALEKLATLKLELETSNGCETKEGLVSANIRLAHLLTVGQQALERNSVRQRFEEQTASTRQIEWNRGNKGARELKLTLRWIVFKPQFYGSSRKLCGS